MDGQVRMTRRLCTEASETSIETEGGAQVWAREIPEKSGMRARKGPRNGNSLGMSQPGEKARRALRRVCRRLCESLRSWA